ncbi:MAG: hypothetical protein R3E84_14830 [Pseudomonadales bacterium]
MTVPVITTLYASLLAIVVTWVTWKGSRFHAGLRVPYRYRPEILGETPFALLLLLLAEQLRLPPVVLHLGGILVLAGRLESARILLHHMGKWSASPSRGSILTWSGIVISVQPRG